MLHTWLMSNMSTPGVTMTERRQLSTGVLLTVSEVAAAMRVSNMTVYRLIKLGQLPAVRVGKSYRIRQSELDAFLESRSVHVEQA
jgi:excisionase family DNA binding protein